MAKRPGMTIPLPRGSRPPEWCPRCLGSPYKLRKPFQALSPGLLAYFQDRGYRALAQCSGCWYVVIEVEE